VPTTSAPKQAPPLAARIAEETARTVEEAAHIAADARIAVVSLAVRMEEAVEPPATICQS
jgi:hypothetical protein